MAAVMHEYLYVLEKKQRSNIETMSATDKRNRLALLLRNRRINLSHNQVIAEHLYLTGNESNFSVEERDIWEKFLVNAVVWKPITHLDGLRVWVALYNGLCPDKKVSIEFLVQSGAIRKHGKHLVVFEKLTKAIPLFDLGLGWTFVIGHKNFNTTEIDIIRSVISKRFQTIKLIRDRWYISDPVHKWQEEDAIFLVNFAQKTECKIDLLGIYFKACALGVKYQFIDFLPQRTSQELAQLLSEILCKNAASLLYTADIQLSESELEQNQTLSSKSLSQLFAFKSKHTRLDHDSIKTEVVGYFKEIIESLTLIKEEKCPGMFFRLIEKLPIGKTFFELVEYLIKNQPQVIASLLLHSAYRREGAFAISQIEKPVEQTVRALETQSLNYYNLEACWIELQLLARWLIINPDNGFDVETAVSLALEDERNDNGSNEAKKIQLSLRLKPWQKHFESRERAEDIVNYLSNLFTETTSVTNTLLAFSLHILELLQIYPELSQKLAHTFVESYVSIVASLALDKKVDVLNYMRQVLQRSSEVESKNLFDVIVDDYPIWSTLDESNKIIALHKHGTYLLALYGVLKEAGVQATINRFLKPFEFLTDSIEADTLLPTVFITHAENLLALANSVPDSDINTLEEITSAFASFYDQQVDVQTTSPESSKVKITTKPLAAFALRNVSPDNNDSLPFLSRLVKSLARGNNLKENLLIKLTSKDPTALELAQLSMGLRDIKIDGKDHLLAQLKSTLKSTINGRFTINEAFQLAQLLCVCGLYEQAEFFARKLMSDKTDKTYSNIQEFLWIALWGQGPQRWNEILDIEHDGLPLEAVLKNLQASVYIQKKEHEKAHELLKQVLHIEPKNKIALTNIATCYCDEKKWNEALQAVNQAQQNLSPNIPPELYEVEAIASWNCNKLEQSVAAVRKLPRAFLRKPYIMELRTNLLVSTAPDIGEFYKDLEELESNENTRAIAQEIKERLAPVSKIDVVVNSFDMYKHQVWSFEQRCKQCGEKPKEWLKKLLSNACFKLTKQPTKYENSNEDQITNDIEISTSSLLGQFDACYYPRHPSGYGPKREGIADFVIEESKSRFPLVTGEAKIWDGQAWLRKGIAQVLGCGNTGKEFFYAVIVYYQGSKTKFHECIKKTKTTIKDFVKTKDDIKYFQINGDITETRQGDTLIVLESHHRVCSDDGGVRGDRTIYTFLVDLASEPSKVVRQQASKVGTKVPRAKKATNSSTKKTAKKGKKTST